MSNADKIIELFAEILGVAMLASCFVAVYKLFGLYAFIATISASAISNISRRIK